MKNLVAKLKGLNYKQLVIDHGEKGVFGLFALIVLVFLAGTSWSRYEKEPEQFLEKVAKGEAAIKASAWSDERKKDFRAVRDIAEEVKMLHSPLEASRFEYSTPWFWPMYPQTKPGADPKLLAVLELVSDVGRFIMIEQPNEQPQNLVAGVFDKGESEDGKKGVSADDDNAPRRTGNDDTAPRVGVGAAVGANPAGADPQAAMQMQARMAGGSGGSGMAGNQPTVNARGVRFAAVRGVFPLKDQVEDFAKAIQLETSQAAELVEFLDFELQRQVALSGNPDPWSGKWEPVDLQAALDVIDRVDFDTELVDTAFTDAVFTMPLPRRVAGTWNKYASHPKIKDLSKEMAEAQAQLMQKMVEDAEARKLEAPKGKKGFSGKVNDMRVMRTQMNSAPSMGGPSAGSGSSSMAAMMCQVNDDVTAGSAMPFSQGMNFGSGPNNSFASAVTSMGNQMQKTDTRLSKYLLFRYFDFTVTPGNAYRYRVRLVLRNPNYTRPVEELVDASVAEGDVRMTPWSEPTTPSVIPEEQKVFLAKIDKGRPESGVAPVVNMDIVQWFADAGTNIAVKLEKLQLGQFVGGRAKTEVLRPEMSLKEEEIPVFTGSILADIATAPLTELDAAEHADLKVDAKKLKQLGTVDKALLVDRFGHLLALDPKASEDDQRRSLRSVEEEHRVWSHLKSRNDAAGAARPSDLDRLAGKNSSASASSGDMMNMMMGGMMGGAPSPLKKGKGPAGKKPPKNSGGNSSGGSSSGGSSPGGASSF